jgi:protocatechuate 3,4-dioxygenase beta subunit
VYLWHCDRDGQYSLYTVTDQNYLRGVQEADADGIVTFASIFPGCYSGRWPHIHFEVFPSLDAATDAANTIATSQVALPEDACAAAYAMDGYGQSVANLEQVSLESDNVFGEDGGAQQLGTVTGSVEAGYVVELAVPVTF